MLALLALGVVLLSLFILVENYISKYLEKVFKITARNALSGNSA